MAASATRAREPAGSCAVTASCSRAAALPVGAASAIAGQRAGLLGQQRQQPGHGGGLAGAGAAREHRDVPQHAHRRGEPLTGGRLLREVRGEARPQRVEVDGGRREGGALGQRPAYQLLLTPEALQVEQAVDEPQRPPGRSRRPVGDDGPARHAASHSGGDGHGSAETSSGSSLSPSTVWWTAARSTHTDPSRAARTASAAASRTCSSGSPPSRPTRLATWTSAASSTPASLNAPSRPAAVWARRGSPRSVIIGSRPVRAGRTARR